MRPSTRTERTHSLDSVETRPALIPHLPYSWEALEKEAKARSFVFVVERNDKVTFDFGLNQARDAAMKMNGNIPVGGFQDVTSDSRGNIYALGSFGGRMHSVLKRLLINLWYNRFCDFEDFACLRWQGQAIV